MLKKKTLRFVSAFLFTFSLLFIQSKFCYAKNDTDLGGEKLVGAVVGVGALTALALWLLGDNSSDSSTPTPPVNNGNPVILSISNYNLLYMKNGGGSVPGNIYVLNNSAQAASGFTLKSSSSFVTVSSNSSCLRTVAPGETCSFEVSYTGSTGHTRSVLPDITRATATLSVNPGTSNSDSITVNTLSVPYGYLFDPTVDGTKAHGVDATVNTYAFVTVPKNGFNFVYVATDNGVFKTSDNRATWVAANGEVLTKVSVRALYVIGSTIYAGTFNGGVFATNNGGATWDSINNGLTGQGLSVNAFFSINEKLYIGTGSGVYELDTSGSGTSWVPVGSNTNVVHALCVVNNTLYAGFYDLGVYYYDTNTSDWIPFGSSSPVKVSSLCSDGNYLYVGDEVQSGVYRIPASGGIWEGFGANLSGVNIFSLCIINGNLYAGNGSGGAGVYKIDPNATTPSWTPVNTGFRNQTSKVFALYANPNAASPLLYAGLAGSGGGGIYRTTPATSPNVEKWDFVSNTLTNKNVSALFNAGSDVIYAGTYGDGVFSSTDGGANWTPLTNEGLTTLNVNAVALYENYLYAGVDNGTDTSTPNSNAVFRIDTTSATASWDIASTGLDSQCKQGSLNFCKLSAETFNVDSKGLRVGIYNAFSATEGGGVYLFNSATTPASWTFISGWSTPVGRTNAISSSPNSFWASYSWHSGSSYLGGVYTSSSNPPEVSGNAWTIYGSSLANPNVVSLQYNPNDGYLYAGSANTTTSVISRINASNSSSVWNDLTIPAMNGKSANALCGYNGQVYAGFGNSGGVYAHDGVQWTRIGSDIMDISVSALQADTSNLYAGTISNGVLKAIMTNAA